MLRKLGIGIAVLLVLAALVAIRFDLPAAEVDAKYRTPHSHFVTLANGNRIHYWDRGNASSPVLVLLHGSYDCANTWEDWAPHLERDFRLIVPDLPAHGLTGKTVENDYAVETMVANVHALLDKLGIARISMAGNSMGGNVSWRYALAHPEQVERLVLVDAAGYPQVDTVSRRATNPVLRVLYRWGNPLRMIRQGLERAVVDDSVITDARVERSAAYVRRDGGREAQIKRADQRNMAGQPYQRIREIQQPTLILWGDRDELIAVQHAHDFERDLPNRQLIIYPGIGHLPQLEIPERSANDARAFLLASWPKQAETQAPTAATSP